MSRCTGPDFKKGDDKPLATWTPPVASISNNTRSTRKNKTYISYLLLFFGFRARYRSRSFRWSPSRESRYLSCALH